MGGLCACGNMRFAYRNREFWCKGYYVDAVGENAKVMIICCGEVRREPYIVEIDNACHVAVQDYTAVVDTNFPRGESSQWGYLQTNIGGQRKKMQGLPKVCLVSENKRFQRLLIVTSPIKSWVE